MEIEGVIQLPSLFAPGMSDPEPVSSRLNSIVAYSINISTTNFLLHSRSTESLRSEWPKKCQYFGSLLFSPQKTLEASVPWEIFLFCDDSNKRMKSKSPRF